VTTGDIGLAEEGEDHHRFVSELIDLGHAYGNMVAATIAPFDLNERAALYYNRVNGVTAQMALILAALRHGDQDSVVNEKARIAANFVDLLVVLRAVNDESTRPDDLNREVLSAVPRVRTCTSMTELSAVLGEQLPELSFDVMPTFGLRGDNRAQVRYVLARLTAYVEKSMGNADAVESHPAKTATGRKTCAGWNFLARRPRRRHRSATRRLPRRYFPYQQVVEGPSCARTNNLRKIDECPASRAQSCRTAVDRTRPTRASARRPAGNDHEPHQILHRLTPVLRTDRHMIDVGPRGSRPATATEHADERRAPSQR